VSRIRPAGQLLISFLSRRELLALLLLVYCYFQVWKPLQNFHCNDFKHIYLGVQAVWTRQDPYTAESLLRIAQEYGLGNEALNPYVYLPFTAIALGFLRPLTFVQAAYVWFIVNHLSMLLSLWFIVLLVGGMSELRWPRLRVANLLLLGVCFSHPWARTLTAGQLNGVLLLIYALSAWLIWCRRETLSAFLLGFGAMFKLSPGIFILYFGLRRRWRAASTMLLSMIVLGLISVAIAGMKMHLDFLPMLRQMGYGHSTWEEYGATFWKDPWNQSLNSLLTHLLVPANRVTVAWAELSQNVANVLTTVGVLVLLAGFLKVGLQMAINCEERNARERRLGEQAFFQACLLLSLLIPSLLWDHYLVQLVLPVAVLSTIALEYRNWALFSLTVASYFLTILPWRFDAEYFRTGAGILLMSVKLYPTLLLYGIALYWTHFLERNCLHSSSLPVSR